MYIGLLPVLFHSLQPSKTEKIIIIVKLYINTSFT